VDISAYPPHIAHVATGFSGIIPSFSFSCAIAGIAMQLRDSIKANAIASSFLVLFIFVSSRSIK
jgi:hypothetical protein